jgi:peroxiredoxin
MPNLKTLYENTDRSKIEFLGIVGDSPAEGLEKMIERFGITWQQILSDETNPIVKKYGVNSYPTTLLIDPEGIIIAKNLRGKALEDKIKELIAD